MKLRLLSDLHLELHSLPILNFKLDADVAILAGDIGNPFQDNYIGLLRLMSLTHSKVFVISGNHEYYNKRTMSKIDAKINKLCLDHDNIHFLQLGSIVYNRIKFMGCTLWSEPTDPSLCKYMNDFNYISTDDRTFTFDKYVSKHLIHKEWLESELAVENDGSYDKICVVTHHLPLMELIDVEYTDHPLNSFFASDINVRGADVWCYGHTHKTNHVNIAGVEFHCNPRGYENETTGWDLDCVFEI